jgi:hypothetical protein
MPLIAGRIALVASLLLAGAGPAGTQEITGTNRVVATYADWRVVLADTNRGKVCYAAGSPRMRRPEGAVRGRAYIFVTTRPDDRVRDEVSVLFGFEAARRSSLELGAETYALSGDAQGAWIADLAEETRLVAAMRRQSGLRVHSRSELGEDTVDTYSLKGFGEALDHARRECADPASTSAVPGPAARPA